ncbi:MAG: TlpA disulfide reductase family protein [Pseudomonadota bacterium]
MKNTILLLITLMTSAVLAGQGTIIQPADKINEALENQLEDGRYELVMFWATYCHTCKQDFKALGEYIKDNPDLPFTLVGVVVDGTDETSKTEELVEKHDLNYAHILTDYDTANEFYTETTDMQLMGTPSYILYDKNNKFVGVNPNSIDIEALDLFFSD